MNANLTFDFDEIPCNYISFNDKKIKNNSMCKFQVLQVEKIIEIKFQTKSDKIKFFMFTLTHYGHYDIS